MDTRIALAGTPIDPVGALSNGFAAGLQNAQGQRQNALAQLYQTQGPGIMAGDPGALNSLAQFDPTAAMGIQAQQSQMAFNAESLQIKREEAKRAAAEAAAKMTAEQRAAEAAQLNTVLKGAAAAYATGDKAAYDGFLQRNGIDPALYPMEQFPMIAAMGDGIMEVLKTTKDLMAPPPGPEWRAATPDEASRYGAAGGQINAQTGEFKPINPPSGGIQFDPETGKVLSIGGPAGVNMKLTEGQEKATGFLIRMQSSNAILDQLEAQGTDFIAKMKAKDPTGLLNYTQDPQYQLYDQAKRDFINAQLRRESGAVIGVEEFANAERQYFPQPGDSPQVIEQKRQNRANALKGMEVGSGPGASNPLVTGSDSIEGTQSAPIQIGPAGEGFNKVKPGQFYQAPDGNVYQKM